MRLFTKEELFNKHGKGIMYFSNAKGNTELEKYKNSFVRSGTDIEYTIQGKNELLTCIVRYNQTSNGGEGDGYYALVFNSLGEFILDGYDDEYILEDETIGAVEAYLEDEGLI
jgi:hypothetical protein